MTISPRHAVKTLKRGGKEEAEKIKLSRIVIVISLNTDQNRCLHTYSDCHSCGLLGLIDLILCFLRVSGFCSSSCSRRMSIRTPFDQYWGTQRRFDLP